MLTNATPDLTAHQKAELFADRCRQHGHRLRAGAVEAFAREFEAGHDLKTRYRNLHALAVELFVPDGIELPWGVVVKP